MKALSIIVLGGLVPLLCFATGEPTAAAALPDPGAVIVKEMDVLKDLMGALTTKGMGTLAIVGVASQLLMKALQTKLIGGWAGKWRYALVYAFNLVGGVISLMVGGGMGLVPALFHSNTLGMMSHSVHQLYKQFVVKKN